MFIILVYDIGQKRVSKVMKICRKYLMHVQKSVFEGRLTPSNYRQLKRELATVIDYHLDSIIIYHLESPRYTNKEEIGKIKHQSNIL
ncbi:CRISPR-associated endonuclease Cas2 [Streptococcus sp. sy018]|uniref:CRISPR-associated endonuclease Cas2 n=1 Tax=Streptococcus sp. sy018 TaxID=2600147 RepID=UPI0011B4E729|nr:CRISPR-associated endonuclease Cas2 [Streptococcus sp. sy018]TWS95563.1 CRISPR-associated endonuclease Cas2 [Streptococcus sp. sy018]